MQMEARDPANQAVYNKIGFVYYNRTAFYVTLLNVILHFTYGKEILYIIHMFPHPHRYLRYDILPCDFKMFSSWLWLNV